MKINNIVVRYWPDSFESLRMFCAMRHSCFQVLKSDDLECGVIVKSAGVFSVLICASAFEKFDLEALPDVH